MFRCPECRTRRKSYKLFTQHVASAQHKVCACGGYPFVHRPNSPYCEKNLASVYRDAIRRGYDATDVALFHHALPGGKEPPF